MSRGSNRVILRTLAFLVLTAVVGGIVYEQLGRRKDRRTLLQIGTLGDIAGRIFDISCLGEGTPPVIFESGGDGPGFRWSAYQTEVAESPSS